MTSTRWSLADRQRGLTLIEVLVGMVLLSLLAVGLLTTVRIAQGVAARVSRLEQKSQDELIAHRFLRQAIGAAYPILQDPDQSLDHKGLIGDDQSLQLLTTLGRGLGDTGLRKLSIQWEPEMGSGGALVLLVSAGAGGSSPADGVAREVLLEGIKNVEWSYRGNVEPAEWVSHWDQEALPRLVRLRLEYVDPTTGVWPDLVVSTRLTNDANCEFDFVAQGCRGQGHRWLP